MKIIRTKTVKVNTKFKILKIEMQLPHLFNNKSQCETNLIQIQFLIHLYFFR